MHWVEVFDVARSGYKVWYFPALMGAIFVVLFFSAFSPLTTFPKIIQNWRRQDDDEPPPYPVSEHIKTRYVFAALWALLLTVVSVRWAWFDYRQVMAIRESGRFHTVQGTVENFRHLKGDAFDVAGVHFYYSSNIISAGFNDDGGMFRNSGPLHNGALVRIGYIDAPQERGNHLILRLEVAGS